MSAESLAELTAVCPPPRAPVHARGDWSAVESKLCALPADYRALIEAYGTGTFGNLVSILNPFEPNANLELVAAGTRTLIADKISRATAGARWRYPLHPEPGGLLPCGLTDNGDTLYWRTTGAPDEWTIVVLPSRELEGEELAMPLATFLARWLARQLTTKAFGKPSNKTFEPLEPPKLRIEVFFNPISDEREQAAERIAEHLGKTSSKGKHVSDHGSQWHFRANDWDVTFNHHPAGYASIWVDVPADQESALEQRVVEIPATLGWTYWDIAREAPGEQRTRGWPHVELAPEIDAGEDATTTAQPPKPANKSKKQLAKKSKPSKPAKKSKPSKPAKKSKPSKSAKKSKPSKPARK